MFLVMSVLQRPRQKTPRAQWSATSAEYASSGPVRGPETRWHMRWLLDSKSMCTGTCSPNTQTDKGPIETEAGLVAINPSLWWMPKVHLNKDKDSQEYPSMWIPRAATIYSHYLKQWSRLQGEHPWQLFTNLWGLKPDPQVGNTSSLIGKQGRDTVSQNYLSFHDRDNVIEITWNNSHWR